MIQELAGQGIRVWIENGELRFKPKSKMTPELMGKIKAHRHEIARELKESRPDVPAGSFYFIDGQVQPVPPAHFPVIQGLSYGQLKELPATTLYIWSRVLNDHIWLITSRELADRLRDTGKAVYLLEEVARLLEQNLTDPETLRTLHTVKQEMPGSYIQ